MYQMYGEDVIYLIKNKMETEKAAETEPQEESSETAQEKKEKLPGYFHAGKAGRAPVVKNQGEFGTCWAVASSSALESALLRTILRQKMLMERMWRKEALILCLCPIWRGGWGL